VPSLLLRKATLESIKLKALTIPKTPTTPADSNYKDDGDDEDEQNQKHPEGVDPDDIRTYGPNIKYYMHRIHNKKELIVDPYLIRLEYCKQLRKLVKI
jgi:hypothetical protein